MTIIYFQIDAEAFSVQAAAGTFCPLNIVLDRVVLTSTGVLLGCWQVTFYFSLNFEDSFIFSLYFQTAFSTLD